MANQRPRLAASEIEGELLRELQKLPTLHDTQSVRIRPYSGPRNWTWELDNIEPEVGGPEQSKFADVTTLVARLQQHTTSTSALRRRPEDDGSGESRQAHVETNETGRRKQCDASWCTW
jgi:hypothetical protein